MSQAEHRKPLKPSGALDKFKYEDTTPEIGREFLDVNIVDDLWNAPNADEVLRDLAITSKSRLSSPKVPLMSTYNVDSLSNTGGNQSLSEALSSLGRRQISPTSCRRNLSTD